MDFENDVFISYAHIDDEALIEGQKGWIATFHRALEIRLGQLLGRAPRIWRDPKLQGNDVFADRLVERLPGVAVLASIVSPRYMKSDWCVRELREFMKASESSGGVRVGHKARVFKIVKTPVALEQQLPEFQHMLGYDFFATDPHSGRARELSQSGDAEVQRQYWTKLDDLAHDIAELLETLEGVPGSAAAPAPAPAAPAMSSSIAPTLVRTLPPSDAAAPQSSAEAASQAQVSVYLAETTFDLKEKRDAIRRELQGYDVRVLPDRPLPLVAGECEAAIREELARASLSIHLIGRTYGIVPEGATQSMIVLQNELAIERTAAGDFGRLIWLPDDLQCEDERQLKFIDHLQTDARIQQGADIVQTSLEDFKTVIHRRLRPEKEEEKAEEAEAPAAGAGAAGEGELVRIYLVSDQRDGEAPAAVADYLYEQGYEVILPVFDGDEAQIRKDHEENLSVCDAVLLYYGEANELWLRAKLREVQKSAAFGRKKPIVAKAICLAPPDSPAKARFRTREAAVIDGRQAFDPAALSEFLGQLKQG